MDEEIKFICELCGDPFDAIPDAMLECSADFIAVDEETGEIVEIDEEMKKEVLSDASEHPEIAPFLKGVICVCLECQDKFENVED